MTADAAGRHHIERLGRRGDGIAGGPVYAARTLPGEIVTGTVEGDRIAAPKIATPSPDRVTPPCAHFKRCGGCAVQHASNAFVAGWKVGIVRDALARAGLEADIAGIETSPHASRRRAALSGRKTKKGAEVGFHVRAGAEIVAIPDCRVLSPAILAALPALERVARMAAPRGAEVGLHVTATRTGIDLSVTGARAFEPAMLTDLAQTDLARITWNGEAVLQRSPPRIALGSATVTPPPGAFLQATGEGEAALVRAVTGILEGAARVVDLFAGLGTFTFPAARTAAIHAVEGDGALLAALTEGANHATGLKSVATETRDLIRNPLLTDELARFDAAIVDPPRAGAEAQVAELARSAVATIAFVSCDATTFARDAATLVAAGWRMGPVTVVDQFRWSSHIETVAPFTRIRTR